MIHNGMPIKEQIKILDCENKRYGNEFVLLDTSDATYNVSSFVLGVKSRLLSAFRNNKFLVQVFEEKDRKRLSICRTMIDDNGERLDGISWDDLQKIKNDIGYENYDAIEIYPKKVDEVKVANIRHLWLMETPIEFAWRKPKR